MPHLPLESASHECGKSQNSEGHLKTDDRAGTVAMDGEGLTTQSISLHRPSLDDVFLRQTGRSLRDEPAA